MRRVEAIADDEARMDEAHKSIRAMAVAIVRLTDVRALAARALRAAYPGQWPYRRIAERLKLGGKNPIQDAQHIVRGGRARQRTEGPRRGSKGGGDGRTDGAK